MNISGQDPSQSHNRQVVTHEQLARESDLVYERRLVDPLDVAFAEGAGRQRLISLAARGLERAIHYDSKQDMIEFASDLAYRGFGISEPEQVNRVAQFGGNTAENKVERNTGLSPLARFKLQARQLDMLSIQSLALYQAGKTSHLPKQDRDPLELLEASTKDVIIEGAELLKRAQHEHDTMNGDEKGKSDLRGFMFEQLFITYRRLKLYGDERYDEEMVLGATAFEDNAAVSFHPANHNYDVLVMASDGTTQELIQCKNAHDDSRYQAPIHKITGRAFNRFIGDPGAFISAIRRLAVNSAGTSEHQLIEDQNLLDSLFEDETAARQQQLSQVALIGASA